MNALIITPYLTAPIRNMTDIAEYDLILCADSAYLIAEREGICPHIVIGDFDHGTNVNPSSDRTNITTVPCEKDDTDTMLCLKRAMAEGADFVTILGGIGGRLDHTFANIQTLAYAQSHGIPARLLGEHDEVNLISPNKTVRISKGKTPRYLSVFAYDSVCRGVFIKGTKYEIEDATLDTSFPLGVSNEITSDFAEISAQSGRLLLILSKKD